MNTTFNKLQQYLFIILALTIPISVFATNVIIVSIIFCWIFDGKLKQKISLLINSNWIICLCILLIIYLLGIFWGSNHNNAIWEFQKLSLLLFFPIMYTVRLEKRTIRIATLVFLSTMFFSAVLAIFINLGILNPLSEITSIIKHENASAFLQYNYHNILLSFAFLIAAYIFIEHKNKFNYIFLIFIIFYAISIFTEKGRAGQIIFNLSTFVLIIYYNQKKIIRLISFLLLLLASQYIIYEFSTVYKNRVNELTEIIKKPKSNTLNQTTDVRFLFLKESIPIILQRPFFGHGTGSFINTFNREAKTTNSFRQHITPHNNYLFVLFELGFFGLSFLILIFYYQLRELYNKSHSVHRILLPSSFLFLMFVDSYLFIFTLTITYIFLYTIYSKY